MRPFIILLLSAASLFGGETLVPIKSGETRTISYGLYYVGSKSRSGTNAPPGEDLLLTLRNIGSKWIGTQEVSAEDFSLSDAQGQKVKIWRADASSSGMGFGSVCFIHLVIANQKAPQPWTLHFKSKPKNIVGVDLTITDIEPEKKSISN